MPLDPTLRDQLAKTIHDAACRCAYFPDNHPINRAGYLTAADKAAELLQSQPAPIVLPTAKEVREAIIAGTKLGGWMPHTAAQAVLDLIASRVRHWVPVEPGTLIKAGTHYRIECCDGRANEYVASCDRKTDESAPVYIDPATVPAEPEDPRIKRAHAIIPALQRVKNVPLGGDLLPAALEAIDAIDALEADR